MVYAIILKNENIHNIAHTNGENENDSNVANIDQTISKQTNKPTFLNTKISTTDKKGDSNTKNVKKNNYSILDYFDLKRQKKQTVDNDKKFNLFNNLDDDKNNHLKKNFKDNFFNPQIKESSNSKHSDILLQYIAYIYEKKKRDPKNIKEHILKLLILLKKRDIYLKKYCKKVYLSELAKKNNKIKNGKKSNNACNTLEDVNEKLYINNIYNKKIKNVKFYSNIINNTIYEYKVTYCKENEVICFHYYDGYKKFYKISNHTFFYLIPNDKSIFYDYSDSNNRQNEDNTCLPCHSHPHIYTFQKNFDNKFRIEIIDTQNKRRNIEFFIDHKPIRVFCNKDYLFFVNVINNVKHVKYFSYSVIYTNESANNDNNTNNNSSSNNDDIKSDFQNNTNPNNGKKIRIVYTSPVHPIYSNAIVNKNSYKFFKKCKYFYEKEKIFMWTDELINFSPEQDRLNMIPNMNIIHINSNTNLCIAFEEITETYFFFHILYDIKKYNDKYLYNYFKKEKLNRFLVFQHFLSIKKNNFFCQGQKIKNINFNTEIYKPQFVFIPGGNKSIHSKIKLCLYDNVNNLLFLIPIYHKYVKDKIKIIKNILNFTTINMSQEFSTFKYYPYNICAYINNQINTTNLKCRNIPMTLEENIINVSTSSKRHSYLKNLLNTKMNMFKDKENIKYEYNNFIKKNKLNNPYILDINKLNHFIIILNTDGMLYLLSDDVYISTVQLYKTIPNNNSTTNINNNKNIKSCDDPNFPDEQVYNLHNSNLCNITLDTVNFSQNNKICLNSYRVHIDILPKNQTLKILLTFFYYYICKKISLEFFIICLHECKKREDDTNIFRFINIDIYFFDDDKNLDNIDEFSHYKNVVENENTQISEDINNVKNKEKECSGNSDKENELSELSKCKLNEINSNDKNMKPVDATNDKLNDSSHTLNHNMHINNKMDKFKILNNNFFDVENMGHIEFCRFIYFFMLICVKDIKTYRKLEKYLYIKKKKNIIETEYSQIHFNCFSFSSETDTDIDKKNDEQNNIHKNCNTENDSNNLVSQNLTSNNSDNIFEGVASRSTSTEEHDSSSTCASFNDTHKQYTKKNTVKNISNDFESYNYYNVINNFIKYVHIKYKHIYNNKYLILTYMHLYYDEINLSEYINQNIKDNIILIILIISYSLNLYNFMFHYFNKFSDLKKKIFNSFYIHICKKYYKHELIRRCYFAEEKCHGAPLCEMEYECLTKKNKENILDKWKLDTQPNSDHNCHNENLHNHDSIKNMTKENTIIGENTINSNDQNEENSKCKPQHTQNNSNTLNRTNEHRMHDKYKFLNNYLKKIYLELNEIPSTLNIIYKIVPNKEEDYKDSIKKSAMDYFFLQNMEYPSKKLKLKYEYYIREIEKIFNIIIKQKEIKNNENCYITENGNINNIKDCFKNFQSFKKSILCNEQVKFLYYFYPLFFPLKNLLIISYMNLFYGQNFNQSIINDSLLRNIIKNELDILYIPHFNLDFMNNNKNLIIPTQNLNSITKEPALSSHDICTPQRETDKKKNIKNFGKGSKIKKYAHCKEASSEKEKLSIKKMTDKEFQNNNNENKYKIEGNGIKTKDSMGPIYSGTHSECAYNEGDQNQDINFYKKKINFYTFNIKCFDSINIVNIDIVNIPLKCIYYENLYLLNKYVQLFYSLLFNTDYLYKTRGTPKMELKDIPLKDKKVLNSDQSINDKTICIDYKSDSPFCIQEAKQKTELDNRNGNNYKNIPIPLGNINLSSPMSILKFAGCYEIFNFQNELFYVNIKREDLFFNKCFDSSNIQLKNNFLKIIDILDSGIEISSSNTNMFMYYTDAYIERKKLYMKKKRNRRKKKNKDDQISEGDDEEKKKSNKQKKTDNSYNNNNNNDDCNNEPWNYNQNEDDEKSSVYKKNRIIQKSYLSEYKILKDCCFFFDTFKMDRNISSCYFPHNKDHVLVYLNNFHNYYFSKYYKKRKVHLLKSRDGKIQNRPANNLLENDGLGGPCGANQIKDDGNYSDTRNDDLIDLADIGNSSDSLESAYLHKHKYNKKNVNKYIKQIVQLVELNKLEKKNILIDIKNDKSLDNTLGLMHLYYTLEKFYKMKYVSMLNISGINFFNIVNSVHYKPDINFTIKYNLYVYLFDSKNHQSMLSSASMNQNETFSNNIISSLGYNRDISEDINYNRSSYNSRNSFRNSFNESNYLSNRRFSRDQFNHYVNSIARRDSNIAINPFNNNNNNNMVTDSRGHENQRENHNNEHARAENTYNSIYMTRNAYLRNNNTHRNYDEYDMNNNQNRRLYTDTFNESSEVTMLNRRIREFNSYWNSDSPNIREDRPQGNDEVSRTDTGNAFPNNQIDEPREDETDNLHLNRPSRNLNTSPNDISPNGENELNYNQNRNSNRISNRISNRDSRNRRSSNFIQNFNTNNNISEYYIDEDIGRNEIQRENRNSNYADRNDMNESEYNSLYSYPHFRNNSVNFTRDIVSFTFNTPPNIQHRSKLERIKCSYKKRNKKRINKIKLKINSILNTLNVHMKTDKMEKTFTLNKYIKKLNTYKSILRNFNTVTTKKLKNKMGISTGSRSSFFLDNTITTLNNNSNNNRENINDNQNLSGQREGMTNGQTQNNGNRLESSRSSSSASSFSNIESENHSPNNRNDRTNNYNTSARYVNNINLDEHDRNINNTSYERNIGNTSFNGNYIGRDKIQNQSFSPINNSPIYNNDNSSNDEYYSSNFLYTPNKPLNEYTENDKINDISFYNVHRRPSLNIYYNGNSRMSNNIYSRRSSYYINNEIEESSPSIQQYDRQNSYLINNDIRRDSILAELNMYNRGNNNDDSYESLNYGHQHRISGNSVLSRRNVSFYNDEHLRRQRNNLNETISSYTDTIPDENDNYRYYNNNINNNIYGINNLKYKLKKKLDYYDFSFDKEQSIKYNNFVNGKIRNELKLHCSICQTILYKKYDEIDKKKNLVLLKIINNENYLYKFFNKNYKYCGVYYLAGLIFGLGLLQFFQNVNVSLFLQYILKFKNRSLYICSILGLSLSLISSRNIDLTFVCINFLFKELYGTQKIKYQNLLIRCLNTNMCKIDVYEDRDATKATFQNRGTKQRNTYKYNEKDTNLSSNSVDEFRNNNYKNMYMNNSDCFNFLYAYDNELSDETTTTEHFSTDSSNMSKNLTIDITNNFNDQNEYQSRLPNLEQQSSRISEQNNADLNRQNNSSTSKCIENNDQYKQGSQNDRKNNSIQNYMKDELNIYDDDELNEFTKKYDNIDEIYSLLNVSMHESDFSEMSPKKRMGESGQLYFGNDDKNPNNINSRNKTIDKNVSGNNANIVDSNGQNNGNNSNNRRIEQEYKWNLLKRYEELDRIKKQKKKKNTHLDNLVFSSNILCLGYLHMNSKNESLIKTIFKLLQKRDLNKLNLLCIFWAIGCINFKNGNIFNNLISSLFYFINANIPFNIHKNSFIKNYSLKYLNLDGISYNLMHMIISSSISVSLCFYKSNNIHAFNMIFMPIKFDHIYYFNNYEIMVKSFARNMIIFDFVDLSHAYILANIPKFLRILPNDLNRNKKNQLPYMHLIDEKGNFKDPDLENKYFLKDGHLNLQHLFVSNQINRAKKYINQDGYYFTFDQNKGYFNCFNDLIKQDDNISNMNYFFHGYDYNNFSDCTHNNDDLKINRTSNDIIKGDTKNCQKNDEEKLLNNHAFIYNCEILRYYIIIGVLQVLSLKYLSTHNDILKKICFDYIYYFENINKDIYLKNKIKKLYKKINYLVQKINHNLGNEKNQDKKKKNKKKQVSYKSNPNTYSKSQKNNNLENDNEEPIYSDHSILNSNGSDNQLSKKNIKGNRNGQNADKTTSYFNQYEEERGQTNADEENISDYNNKFEIDNNFYNFIADINFNNSSSSNDSEALKKSKNKKRSGRNSSRDGTEHDNMRSQLNTGISPNDNNPQSDISQTKNKNKNSRRNMKNKKGVIINDNKNNASTYSHIYKLILKYVKQIKKIKKYLENSYETINMSNTTIDKETYLKEFFKAEEIKKQKKETNGDYICVIKEDDINDIINLMYQCLSFTFVGSCDKMLNKKIKKKINNLINIRDKNTNNLYYYYLGYINLGSGKYILKKQTGLSICTLTLILFTFFHIYDLSSRFIIHLIEFLYVLLMDKSFLKIYDLTSNKFVNLPIQLIYKEKVTTYTFQKNTFKETEINTTPQKANQAISDTAPNDEYLLRKKSYSNYNKKIISSPSAIPLLDIINLSIKNSEYYSLSFSCPTKEKNNEKECYINDGDKPKRLEVDHLSNISYNPSYFESSKNADKNNMIKKIIKRGILFVKKKECTNDFVDYNMLEDVYANIENNEANEIDQINDNFKNDNNYTSDHHRFYLKCENKQNILRNQIMKYTKKQIYILKFLTEIIKYYEKIPFIYSDETLMQFQLKNSYTHTNANEILMLKYYVNIEDDQNKELYHNKQLLEQKYSKLFLHFNDEFNKIIHKIDHINNEDKYGKYQNFLKHIYQYIYNYYMNSSPKLESNSLNEQNDDNQKSIKDYLKKFMNLENDLKKGNETNTQITSISYSVTQNTNTPFFSIININNMYKNKHFKNNIYTIYYKNKEKNEHNLINDINKLLVDYSIIKIKTFTKYLLPKEVYNNYFFFVLIQNLHIDKCVNYLPVLSEIYNNFYFFYEFFYKYWESFYLEQHEKFATQFRIPTFTNERHKNCINKNNCEKSEEPIIYDLEFFDYFTNVQKDDKKTEKYIYIDDIYNNRDGGKYLLHKYTNNRYCLQGNNKNEIFKRNENTLLQKSISTTHKPIYMKERKKNLKNTFFNKLDYILSCNIDYLKILEALYKNCTTKTNLIKYLLFLNNDYYFTYFFENNIKLIKTIFIQYYQKGYIDKTIIFNTQKITVTVSKNLIYLYTTYCNFPTYYQFWNTLIKNHENYIFIPQHRYLYNYKYNEYVRSLIFKVNKLIHTYGQNCQANKIIQKARSNYKNAHTRRGNKLYYHYNCQHICSIDRRNKQRKRKRALPNKQLYKTNMYKLQNYLKEKTKNKKIDKRNVLLHKTNGGPHHSIYLLKQIAYIIQNNEKIKTNELKKLLLNLQTNNSPFDIYNFFKKWLNKSEHVSKMLIDTYNVSLFSTYINLFFTDILFCFFIGNL
ncbi:conserved Plasmodium protein, unknown function [Plasmodium chabaudi chabaudi]|uniref:Anaphase-promoting complex subunit 1 n=1 Tax=Plasmodium chabaudi chabaudi TaxID=31271 RepID=A0A4V0K241_PLACU|nr:conserved Plasmodium protein, unknown function [Plasmodium chabaudi chabaudi]VTZ66884.1 conserved Plasmodium protein, unknown function [Plasmodium chabaudi chabaudi]|eukprot:XP_745022.2 conserved Plasmodium protein, unknown function [Plasmodium chabaudi chabaudi]